jgi:hypothetical protein
LSEHPVQKHHDGTVLGAGALWAGNARHASSAITAQAPIVAAIT